MTVRIFEGVFRVVVDVADMEDDDGNTLPEPTLEELRDYLAKAGEVNWNQEDHGNAVGVSAMELDYETLVETSNNLVVALDPDQRCPPSPNGLHQPDPSTLTPADGYDPDTEGGIVADVSCRHCGRSGSTRIDFPDIMW